MLSSGGPSADFRHEVQVPRPATDQAAVRLWFAADPTCPWCASGFANLKEAERLLLSQQGVALRIEVLPFDMGSLLPDFARGLQDTGAPADPGSQPFSSTCGCSPCSGNGPPAPRTDDLSGCSASSADALRLIYASKREGKSSEMLEIMLRLAHVEGQDLTDPRVLQMATEEAKLQLNASAYLRLEEDLICLYSDMEYLKEASLSSVPAFVIGEEFRVLTGAQSPQALQQAVLQSLNASASLRPLADVDGAEVDKSSLLYVTLGTTDLRRAASFYQDGLGLSEVKGLHSRCASTLTMKLRLSSHCSLAELRIVQVADAHEVRRTTLGSYVCMYIPSLAMFDDILARLEMMGINTDHAERTPLTGQAFLKDWDGNTIQLETTPPAASRTCPPSEMRLHHLGVTYLPGHMLSVRAFYQRVLGATPLSPRWMSLGGMPLHLVPAHEHGAGGDQQLAVGLPSKAYTAAVKSARKQGCLVNNTQHDMGKRWNKFARFASPAKRRRLQSCQLVMDQSMEQPVLLVNLDAPSL